MIIKSIVLANGLCRNKVYFLSFEAKRIRQKISSKSYCCNVPHAIVVCAHAHTHALSGGRRQEASYNYCIPGERHWWGAAAALDWPGLVCRY